jgi:hypothetical protein
VRLRVLARRLAEKKASLSRGEWLPWPEADELFFHDERCEIRPYFRLRLYPLGNGDHHPSSHALLPFLLFDLGAKSFFVLARERLDVIGPEPQ